jgi:FkbM family methyltransferase
MSLFSKFGWYARAAMAQRGLNLRGLPLIPKSFWPDTPCHREAFNQFIIWIHRLQVSRVNLVVDVGANRGDFSLAASMVYPGAQVMLVEPLPKLQPELERRCARRNGRWRLATCALGSRAGSATLHVDPNFDAIGSLLEFSEEYLEANPLARPNQSLTCTVRTLDELCAEQGIQTIDLLKIDVEGFEFEVLQGAARMLHATTALIIELSLVRRGGGSEALTRMLEVLSAAGLRLVELYPSLFSKEAPWLPVEFNLLARRL